MDIRLLVERAARLDRLTHPSKYRQQYEFQGYCKSLIESNEITQGNYDHIVRVMGGEVRKI